MQYADRADGAAGAAASCPAGGKPAGGGEAKTASFDFSRTVPGCDGVDPAGGNGDLRPAGGDHGRCDHHSDRAAQRSAGLCAGIPHGAHPGSPQRYDCPYRPGIPGRDPYHPSGGGAGERRRDPGGGRGQSACGLPDPPVSGAVCRGIRADRGIRARGEASRRTGRYGQRTGQGYPAPASPRAPGRQW